MTYKTKQEIITQIVSLLTQLIEAEETQQPESTAHSEDRPVEMLTVKECAKEIKELTENTVRQLIAQGKLPHIRSGQGKHGKILISKDALLSYFRGGM